VQEFTGWQENDAASHASRLSSPRPAVSSSGGRKGRSADNELRMLQANFAKAYAALQTHSRDCGYCQMPALVHQGFGVNPVAHHYPLH